MKSVKRRCEFKWAKGVRSEKNAIQVTEDIL